MKIVQTLLAAVLLSVAACQPSPVLSPDNQINVFLEQNHPLLKSLRDSVAGQIIETRSNIHQLYELSRSFTGQESKDIVMQRIQHQISIRDQLWIQLSRIDTEAEKGIALNYFNRVDGGGLNSQDLETLMRDIQYRISKIREVNNQCSISYNTVTPPKAVPVLR